MTASRFSASPPTRHDGPPAHAATTHAATTHALIAYAVIASGGLADYGVAADIGALMDPWYLDPGIQLPLDPATGRRYDPARTAPARTAPATAAAPAGPSVTV